MDVREHDEGQRRIFGVWDEQKIAPRTSARPVSSKEGEADAEQITLTTKSPILRFSLCLLASIADPVKRYSSSKDKEV